MGRRSYATQPQSEFLAVDAVTDPRRDRTQASIPSIERNRRLASPFGYSSTGSVTASSRSPPTELRPRASTNKMSNPRQKILESFQQGRDKGLSEQQGELLHLSETVVPPLGRKACINESTSNFKDRTANTRHVGNKDGDLRSTHKPVPAKSIQGNDSEDELAIAPNGGPIHERTNVISKPPQVANGSIKRIKGVLPSKRAWQLHFARTYNFHSKGPNIYLRPETRTLCHVVGFDEEGNESQLETLDMQLIGKQTDDNISRIRLQGPRSVDGTVYTCDLEFVHTEDFRRFLDEHVVRGSGVRRPVRRTS